jgi:hypothetical protein
MDFRMPLTGQRIGTFALNMVTIATMALGAYAWTGMRREDLRRFQSHFK